MSTYTDIDLEQMYDDMLDEVYPEIVFGEIVLCPSEVLKKCDPIAYRIGKSEYVDSLEEDDDE